MLRNLQILPVAVAAAVCMLIVGCTSQCYDNQSSIGLAGFYDSTTKREISIGMIDVYGVGAPNDSAILKTTGAVSQVYLPMPVEGNECAFVIHYREEAISSELLNDTLTLHYDAVPYFAGSECGAMYIYKINSFDYTQHIVDSIAIPTMEINNLDMETIKIYMRTSSGTE